MASCVGPNCPWLARSIGRGSEIRGASFRRPVFTSPGERAAPQDRGYPMNLEPKGADGGTDGAPTPLAVLALTLDGEFGEKVVDAILSRDAHDDSEALQQHADH
jgi:hypothetical protein